MANEIQQSSDLWDVEKYLTQRRKEIDRNLSAFRTCAGFWETLARKTSQ
jgi:hypothetical protein